MIHAEALQKVKILLFLEKHGLAAAMEAFSIKRRMLFLWKQKFKKEEIKALNNRSRPPNRRRSRQWSAQVLEEIRHLREQHPNLGKDKLYLPLARFCEHNGLSCSKPSTIGRLVKDYGGLRTRPLKLSCAGRRKMKREKVIRKPKDLAIRSPGQVVALDTIERFVEGCRRYVITFEDIHTRFAFAWGTTSHASLAAKEFFDYCRLVFPYPFTFVLTDNGSEFKKHFAEELKRLHLVHYHTYPKTPKVNAHCERFNRTIQEEFIDFHVHSLLNPPEFNQKLIE
jgi:transposase InsO family protein